MGRITIKKEIVPFWGLHELKDTFELCRCLLSETVATALLIYLATTNCARFPDNHDLLKISLLVGLAVATIVMIFAPVSGSHINPAVTLGFLIVGRMSALKALMYVHAQILGTVVGTVLYEVTTPEEVQGDELCSKGINTLAGVTTVQALVVEAVIGFILVFLILTLSDVNHRPPPGGNGFTVVAFFATAAFLMGLKYSGVAMNPARSIGILILKQIMWDSIWVYWTGPMVGAALAGVLYRTYFDLAFQ